MEVTESPERFRAASEEARETGAIVGFVPTMGALHRGHSRLLQEAAAECAFVALSIFVNPLQFDSPADLKAYPRELESDLTVARSAKCHLVFTPTEATMYPGGPPEVTVDPGRLGGRLEGRSRAGHFRGVLTLVAKLLHLAGPCRVYFGEKDAQQLALVRRMVSDLELPASVVACPTVREPDGLALSLAVVEEASWEDVVEITGPTRALAAAWLGETRLIDNLVLPWTASATVHNTNEERGGV